MSVAVVRSVALLARMMDLPEAAEASLLLDSSTLCRDLRPSRNNNCLVAAQLSRRVWHAWVRLI
jgi:hypothetical protein